MINRGGNVMQHNCISNKEQMSNYSPSPSSEAFLDFQVYLLL